MSITSMQEPAPAPTASTKALSLSSSPSAEMNNGQVRSLERNMETAFAPIEVTSPGPEALPSLKVARNESTVWGPQQSLQTQPKNGDDDVDVATMVAISRRTARSLWLVLHAERCKFGPGRCPLRGCAKSKQLLRHLSRCRCGVRSSSQYPASLSPCPDNYNGCLQVRNLLAHYRRCGARRQLAKAASLTPGNRQIPSTACLICEQLARISPEDLAKPQTRTTRHGAARDGATFPIFQTSVCRAAPTVDAQSRDRKEDVHMDDITAPNTDASSESSSFSSNGSHNLSTSTPMMAGPSRQSFASALAVVNTSPKASTGATDCKALCSPVPQQKSLRLLSPVLTVGAIGLSKRELRPSEKFIGLNLPTAATNKGIDTAQTFTTVSRPSRLDESTMSRAATTSSHHSVWKPGDDGADTGRVTENFFDLKLCATSLHNEDVDVCREDAASEEDSPSSRTDIRAFRRPRSESFDERWTQGTWSLFPSRPDPSSPQPLTAKIQEQIATKTQSSVVRRPRSQSCGAATSRSIEGMGVGLGGRSCDTIAEEEHEHDSAIP